MLAVTTNKEENEMATDTRRIYLPQGLQLRGAAVSVGRFLWHFLQMVIAMEVGMMVYHMLLWPLLSGTGYGALTQAYPLFGYWMMVASMTLPMIVLMRFHRSSWRYCGEMTIAMLAPLAALTVMVLCYLLPIHTLYGVGDPLMFLAMAAYMLYRPHDHAHDAHGHPGSSGAGMTPQTIHEEDCEGGERNSSHATV
jgi:hypothetical protein